MRHVQQPMMVRLDDIVALAGRLSQTFRVDDVDVAAAVADNSGLLQRVGDNRNRVALHADHLRQEFLRQRQCFAAA